MRARLHETEVVYLKHDNKARLAGGVDELDVPRDGKALWELDAPIQHLQELQQLGVFDNGEGPVPPCAPHCKVESHVGVGILYALAIRRDHLGLGCITRIAVPHMTA